MNVCKLAYFLYAMLLFLVACGEEGTSEPIEYPEESSAEICSSSENAPVSSIADVEISSSSEDFAASSSSDDANSSSSVESSSSFSSSSARSSSSSMVQYVSYGTMTDERDGQIYKTMTIEGEFPNCLKYDPIPYIVKISRATWMIENLNYAYLQPTRDLDSSSRCDNNNPAYCEKFGRRYLWSAALDSAALFSDASKGCGNFATEVEWYRCPLKNGVRGVCPEGWRIPTYDDEYDFAYWRLCVDSEGFNQNLEYDYTDSDYFWLASEDWYYRANVDACDPNSIVWSESYGIHDGAIGIAGKDMFLSVRCVKDVPD